MGRLSLSSQNGDSDNDHGECSGQDQDNNGICNRESTNQNLEPIIKASWTVWLASLVALANAISFGMVIGFNSASIDSLINETKIIRNNRTGEIISGTIDWTDGYQSLFASIVALGSLFGSLGAGPIMTLIGPKYSVIVCHLPFLIGWVLVLDGSTITGLIIGRFLNGFSVGLASGAVPIYCIEISTPNIRGVLGASFQLLTSVGVLIVAILAYFIRYDHVSWVAVGISVIGPAVMLFMPESPAFIYNRAKNKKCVGTLSSPQESSLPVHSVLGASVLVDSLQTDPVEKGFSELTSAQRLQILKTLKRLRTSSSDINYEFQTICSSASAKMKQRLWLSWSELRKKKVYKPLFLSLGLSFMQQCCGVNAVLFFNHKIFAESGVKLATNVIVILTGFVFTIFGIIGNLLVDRFGRKPLLFYTGIILMIALLILATYFQFKPSEDQSVIEYGSKYGLVALISMLSFMGTFMVAFGPITWMMVPEMTPYFARTFVTAIAVGINRLIVFLITEYFTEMSHLIGFNGVFYLFSAITFLSVLFIKFLLPETKGKTMEELDQLFD